MKKGEYADTKHRKTESCMKYDPARAGTLEGIASEFLPVVFCPDHAIKIIVDRLKDGKMTPATTCHHCGFLLQSDAVEKWGQGRRVKCRKCRNAVQFTGGTPLAGLHIKPTEVVMLAALLAFGCNKGEIAARMGRNRGTIHHWLSRLTAKSERQSPTK